MDDYPVPELAITTKIRSFLEDAGTNETTDEKLRERCKLVLKQSGDCKVVPIKLVKDVYTSLKSNGEKINLYELVEGADFVARPVVPPPRDPELEARVHKLRIEAENKEYRRMTQNVDPMQGNQTFSFQSDVKSMNRQLTSVINFLITVVAGFAFGYKIVEYTYGPVFPIQMMAGLTVGTVIFFVDLYFMVKYSPI